MLNRSDDDVDRTRKVTSRTCENENNGSLLSVRQRIELSIEFQFYEQNRFYSNIHCIVVASAHFQIDFHSLLTAADRQTDDAKSSDPDTIDEEDETEMNDLEKRLPSGYESVMTKVVDSKFSCKERGTGFFADVDNDCQVRAVKC